MTDKEFMGKIRFSQAACVEWVVQLALKLVRRGADIAVTYLKRNDESRATQ